MPNTFNFLICILALLVGILIGEKYRKWKKAREEKKEDEKGGGSHTRSSKTDKKKPGDQQK